MPDSSGALLHWRHSPSGEADMEEASNGNCVFAEEIQEGHTVADEVESTSLFFFSCLVAFPVSE